MSKQPLPTSGPIPHGVFVENRSSGELVLHSSHESFGAALSAADELNSPHRVGSDWRISPGAPLYLVRQL